MARSRQFKIQFVLILVFVLNIVLVKPDEKALKCGGGDPCIFMDKDTGWIGWKKPEWKASYEPISDSWKMPNSTLFLTIASFRDKLCPLTLYNIFSKAKYPHRIYPGVVQQNVDGIDMDCLDTYCMLVEDYGLKNHTDPILDAIVSPNSIYAPSKGRKPIHKTHPETSPRCPFEANVRMDRVDARIAQGPTWARARGSQLVQSEEFCMQTDAHMDFVKDWDTKMMETWALTRNEYAVLSTYVAPTEQLKFNEGEGRGLNALHEVPHLCMVTLFGSHNLPRIWGTKCMRSLSEPKLTNGIWGAGLSFSKCHAERKVPYDPHTPQIFDGEEFSRSARFWTWGYDIYTPHRVYVVHNYHVSQSDPTHFEWSRNSVGSGEGSAVRIKTLLSAPGGMTDQVAAEAVRRSRYGLGDRRSLDQYIAFSGVDTKNRKILGNRCGNLEYVPFKQHPFGADYVPKYDSTSEELLDARDPGSIYFSSEGQSAWEEHSAQHDAEMAKLRDEKKGFLKGSRLSASEAAISASIAAFGSTVKISHSPDTHTDLSASSSGSIPRPLDANISRSDAILLGGTVAGIICFFVYAVVCKRHFTKVFLTKGVEAQAKRV